MPSPVDPLAFEILAIACAALVTKMVVTGGRAPAARSRTRQFLNPEDARALGGTVAAEEHPDVQRALRAHRNDVENVPAFMALALLYVLGGGSSLWTAIYCGSFLGVRVLHSVFYLRAVQPHRTIAFALGVVTTAAMMIHTIVNAW